MNKVIVVGAGGHGKVIVDILQKNKKFEVVGLVDEAAKEGFWGIPLLGGDDMLESIRREKQISYAFVALGDGKLRERVTEKVKKAGFQLVNAVSCDAIVSPHVSFGEGIAVMPGAVINGDVTLGDGCIINTNASLDHDCTVGAYTHIAPGGAVCGGVAIGKGCFIGAGSRVIDHLTIGDNTVVGAGAVVVTDIRGNCTVKGVPAKDTERLQ